MTRQQRFFKRISDWTPESVTFEEGPFDSDAAIRVMIDEMLGRPLRFSGQQAREYLERFRAWRALHPDVAVEIPFELP